MHRIAIMQFTPKRNWNLMYVGYPLKAQGSDVQPIRRSPRLANGHLNVANGFAFKYLKT